MEATLLASGLGFPEGPVVLPDGGIAFCDGNVGKLLVYEDAAVDTYTVTGGSPWGAVLGADGAIYVTQGGNVPGSGDTSAVPGIQRVRRAHPVNGPDLLPDPRPRELDRFLGQVRVATDDVGDPGHVVVMGRHEPREGDLVTVRRSSDHGGEPVVVDHGVHVP